MPARRDQQKPPPPELRPVNGIAPPHDLDAEGAVLSACFIDMHALDLCAALQLHAEHFYSHANRIIYEAMTELRTAGTPVDVVTVSSRLNDSGLLNRIGGTPYIGQLVNNTPSIKNVESHALIVRDKWRQRQAISVMKTRAAEGYAQVENIQTWIDNVEADIAELARHFDKARGMLTIGQAGASAMQRIVDARRDGNQGMIGVPFGYTRVDHLTKGMMAGDLIVIAGRPGMGKTSFALGCAINVAQPKVTEQHRYLPGDGSVAFFSLEMTEEQLALRGIALQQRMNAQRLRAFEVAHNEWPLFAEGVAWEQHCAIHIDATPGLSSVDIRSRSRRLKSELEREGKPPLKMVVVDYIQIMGASTTRGEPLREQVVGDNARGLKALGKELGVPVMALAQLNRSVETRTSKDKRPQLSDLRESGAIEQEADLVAFLYRDEYYFPETPDRGIAEFIVAKQRSGPTRTAKLRFTPEYTRFDNLAEECYDFEDLVDAEDR